MINVTRTTLREALLRRGRRGIARTLLLAGMLAGMTFGTVAQAQIAFRAAATPVVGAIGSTTLTINKPTGTVQNDVMIASIAFRLANLSPADTRDIAVTPPAGWTLVGPTGRMDNLNSTQNGLAVYWKAAGASEPASYAWTFSCINVSGQNTCVNTGGFNRAVGGIVSFSGVDITSPIDKESGTSPSSATATPATPSITTTVGNTMLVTSHSIANPNNFASSPPSGMTQSYRVKTATASGTEGVLMLQVSRVLQAAAGATGTKSATDQLDFDSGIDFGNAHILALRPPFASLSSAANQDFWVGQPSTTASVLTVTESATVVTVTATNNIRIRIPATLNMTWDPTVTTVTLGGTAAAKVSTTLLAYEDGNRTVVLDVTSNFAVGETLTITGLKFTNFTAKSAADYLELVTGGAGGATTDEDDKTITIGGTKFYFHDAVTPNLGTLPGATDLSASTPTVTAATAGTNRDMNQTIGTVQVSQSLTTSATTSLQRTWFRRFLSRPLAAQTLPTGVWKIQAGASESNANSNMLPWGAVIKVWRPSTGATVATLLDNPTLGISANEPGTSETNVSSLTASLTGVAVNDGDILMVELWAENTQAIATAYTNTLFYDGTTEGSTSSNAAFLQAPDGITFYRSTYQSAYRWFNNANSTDVGNPLAAQDTAATLISAGAGFRLRMLFHVADINLGVSGQAFKLQFVDKGAGTCAAPTGTTPAVYTDVDSASVIAYNDNATPADGATLTNNANDPTHSGHTLRNQTYDEQNTFTNSVSAINAGEDGKWDFALKDNGTPGNKTYCFRVVKATGTVLDYYYVYPQITTTAVVTPGDFNAVEVGGSAVTGVIKTKIAGATISLDITSLNVARTAINTAFTGTVRVEVIDASNTSTALDTTTACRPGWTTVIQTLTNPTFVVGNNGRLTVSFTVANSYPNVRLRISYPTVSPTLVGCSIDNFAIRPNTFASFAVTDTDWQTTGAPGARALNLLTFAATTPIHKAGRPFSVRATAQNAAGTPATTTNYTGTPTATLTACVGAACTAIFGTLTLTTTFSAGLLASDVASYDNVGSFALQLVDSTFASVDANDGSTTTERNITSSTINVGRFVPDHFAVALNTPAFATACGAGGFTYVGQVFSYATAPVITVTAQGFANNTTTLYAGAWARITNTSLSPAAYDTQGERYSRFDALGGGTTPALNTAGLPATTSDPTIGTFTNGVGTLTFGAGSGLAFTRSTTTPSAPFNADIALTLSVIDSDNVIYASNPVAFGTATANNGIAFDSGKPMRFGRLVIRNANGSQLVPLQVRVEAQYWSGTPTSAFITNTLDSCTSIASANVAMGTYTGNLSSCETAISGGGALSMGRKTLQLAAPGGANNGSVILTVNLGASASGNTCTAVGAGPGPATTTANLPHLQGNWTGANYDQNPAARATFGVSSGANEVIFTRENF